MHQHIQKKEEEEKKQEAVQLWNSQGYFFFTLPIFWKMSSVEVRYTYLHCVVNKLIEHFSTQGNFRENHIILYIDRMRRLESHLSKNISIRKRKKKKKNKENTSNNDHFNISKMKTLLAKWRDQNRMSRMKMSESISIYIYVCVRARRNV